MNRHFKADTQVALRPPPPNRYAYGGLIGTGPAAKTLLFRKKYFDKFYSLKKR